MLHWSGKCPLLIWSLIYRCATETLEEDIAVLGAEENTPKPLLFDLAVSVSLRYVWEINVTLSIGTCIK